MLCKENQERLAAYALGALDASERAEMDAHVDRCGECKAALREDGDLIVHMAYAAPQLEAPASVRQKLMDRVSEDVPQSSPADTVLRWLDGLVNAGHRAVAGPAGAVAGAMVIVLFLVGAWFNVRLNEIADEKEALESQIETIADGEAERTKLVNDLRELAFWTTAPDASVKRLSASDITILLTTQYMEEADQLADQIVVIDHGDVIAAGTSDELKARVGATRLDIVIAADSDFAAAEQILAGQEARVDGKRRLLSIASHEGVHELREVLQRLEEAGVEVEDVSLHRPTLDDVFLTLTGAAATPPANDNGEEDREKKPQ